MDLRTSCTICDSQYDEKKRRPLVLPCSQDCLQQVQAAGEKLCPVCRKTWNNALPSDLPACYQLIPVNTKPERQDFADPDQEFDVCKEHKSDLFMFCESCLVPICRKCILLNHKGCEMVLMVEKCDALKEKFKEKKSEFEGKFSKVATSLVVNVKNMAVLRPLIEKLFIYEKEMQDYQKELKDCQTEAAQVLSVTDDGSAAPLLCNIQNAQLNEAAMEKLDLQLPNSPSSPLLLAIAAAYQEDLDNKDSFMTAFSNGAKELNQGASTSWQSVDEMELNQAVRIAALALKNEEKWNILDDAAVVAAVSVLQTTSLRPSSINISYSNITEEKMAFMAIAFAGIKQYEVTLMEKMNTFDSFDRPSNESLAATALRLDALVKHCPWASLSHFWGHLDKAGIHKLPKTIKSLGLALRDEADMASVNALCGLAFDTVSLQKNYDRMLWPQFSRLELSISKTFRPEFWKLSWRWIPKKTVNAVPIPLYAHPCLSVSLHWPNLVPGDLLWMAALFKEMGVDTHIRRYEKSLLHLPGACVDPDPLLGVLRDSGMCWKVHLPASLPQLVPREEMTKQYEKYNHLVTWDQE